MADVAPAAPAAPNAPSTIPVTNSAPPPGAPVAAAAAPKPEAPFIELVVDGQKQKFTEAEARKLLSKSKFADQTVRQAKEALAAAKKFQAEKEEEDKRWASDTEELLRKRNVDPRDFARKILERELANANLTPDQREAAERTAERDALKAERDALKAEKDQAALSENAKRIQTKMVAELDAAADKYNIPRDADSFFAIYAVAQEFHDLGIPFDAERIAETASQNIDGGFKRLEAAVLKGLKGQALEDRLGKAIADELVRHRVESIRGGGVKKPDAPAAPKPDAGGGYITREQLRDQLRGMKK